MGAAPVKTNEKAKLQAVPRPAPRKRLQTGTLLGLLLAAGCVVLGCYFEGESLRLLLQPTALAVVVLGTLGVVLIQFPLAVVGETLRGAAGMLRRRTEGVDAVAGELLRYARKAQADGVLSLDTELERVRDPYLRKALTLAVDGAGEAEIRLMMQLETRARESMAELVDGLLETAAGVAPPLGILGAVLGLLHVMHLLNDFDQVGRGIAAAFVSTLYGVGLANLLFLPVAGNLRLREAELRRHHEMMLEGVLGILTKTRPRLLEARLGAYTRRAGARPRRSALAG